MLAMRGVTAFFLLIPPETIEKIIAPDEKRTAQCLTAWFWTLLLSSCSSAVQRCGSLILIHFHRGKVTLLLYKVIILMQLVAFLATPVPPLEMCFLSYNCSCQTVLVELKPHSLWVQAGWWNKQCLASFFVTLSTLLPECNERAQITNCSGQPSERIPLRLVQWEDAPFPTVFKMPYCILQYFSWKPPLPRLSHHRTSHSTALPCAWRTLRGNIASEHISNVVSCGDISETAQVSGGITLSVHALMISGPKFFIAVLSGLPKSLLHLDQNIHYVCIYFYLFIHWFCPSIISFLTSLNGLK